jgi:hypothetical protein
MIGKLLKTLGYRVKAEEAEWRSENTVIREMSYNLLQRAIVYIAKHPLGWPLSVLAFLSAVSAALCFTPSCWLPRVPTDFTRADLITYFSALWTGPDAGDIGLKSLNVLIGLNASGKPNPVSRLPWYGLQKYHNRANIKIEMPLTPTLFRRERGIGG